MSRCKQRPRWRSRALTALLWERWRSQLHSTHCTHRAPAALVHTPGPCKADLFSAPSARHWSSQMAQSAGKKTVLGKMLQQKKNNNTARAICLIGFWGSLSRRDSWRDNLVPSKHLEGTKKTSVFVRSSVFLRSYRILTSKIKIWKWEYMWSLKDWNSL